MHKKRMCNRHKYGGLWSMLIPQKNIIIFTYLESWKYEYNPGNYVHADNFLCRQE